MNISIEEPRTGGAMALYHSDKGRIFLSILDLIDYFLETGSGRDPEQQRDLIARIIAHEKFSELAAELFCGDNDGEYSTSSRTGATVRSADSLRMALLAHADTAARKLVATLLEDNQRLRRTLVDKDEHLRKVLQLWPDSYQKYIPKEVFTYAGITYVADETVTKLTDFVRAEQ